MLALLLTACAQTPAERQQDLSPEQFREYISNDGVFVIDVHIPEQQHIPGTDAVIPYNELRMQSRSLPDDRDTSIAIYCRSGSMSEEAMQTFKEMGYTDVVHLEGGLNAWQAAGYEVK
jgi:rhodanese-related sulfurtransferase